MQKFAINCIAIYTTDTLADDKLDFLSIADSLILYVDPLTMTAITF